MEDDQVWKHSNKKYPYGKSLSGSHMRDSDERIEHQNTKKISSLMVNNGGKLLKKELKVDQQFGGGGSSGGGGGPGGPTDQNVAYGLRENPKKTWRAVDQNAPLPQERVCTKCGKVFQSQKALCGHMACHSEKERVTTTKDDYSWSNNEHQYNTYNEIEDRKLRNRSSSSKGYKKYKTIIIKSSSFTLDNNNTTINNNNNNSSSSVSEIDEYEQEEVAKSLMMLSRDSGNKVCVESSDNNSVVVENTRQGLNFVNKDKFEMIEQENSDSGYFLGEYTKDESEVTVGKNFAYWECRKTKSSAVKTEENGVKNSSTKRRRDSFEDNAEGSNSGVTPKRNKYECLNCKKVFKSYQALGGHRPCHKRMNACLTPKYESDENSSGGENIAAPLLSNKRAITKDVKKIKSKKNKGHVCPFCDRVFKSGQALGGHKRSHFIGGNEETTSSQSPIAMMKPEVPDLFDLNLPAPLEDEDEEDDVHFA